MGAYRCSEGQREAATTHTSRNWLKRYYLLIWSIAGSFRPSAICPSNFWLGGYGKNAASTPTKNLLPPKAIGMGGGALEVFFKAPMKFLVHHLFRIKPPKVALPNRKRSKVIEGNYTSFRKEPSTSGRVLDRWGGVMMAVATK